MAMEQNRDPSLPVDERLYNMSVAGWGLVAPVTEANHFPDTLRRVDGLSLTYYAVCEYVQQIAWVRTQSIGLCVTFDGALAVSGVLPPKMRVSCVTR